MNTQNVATDLLTVPKEQAPQKEVAVEKFQAAMKNVTETNDGSAKSTSSESNLKSGKKAEAEQELELEGTQSEALTEREEKAKEDEAVIWFNVNHFRLTETIETPMSVVNAEAIEISEQLSIEAPPVNLAEVYADEILDAIPLSETGEVILPEKFIQAMDVSLSEDVNPVEVENSRTMEQIPSLVQAAKANLIATDVVEEAVVSTENIQQLDGSIETETTVQSVTGAQQTDSKEPISNQNVLNEGVEPVESNLELQEGVTKQELDTEYVNHLGQQVEVEEQDVSIKTETKSTQPTEMTQVGQLNQLRMLQSNPQVESVKVVSQEQWVQEVETFIVDELDGSNTVEKVTTTRIQLTPKHLGEMEIELVIKDKGLTARLVVEEMETKQWLEQKLMQLTNSLATQEIKVEEFHIVVANNERNDLDASFEGNSAFKQRDESSKQKQTFHKGLEEEPVNVRNEQVNRSTAGRLSMWV